MEELLYFGVCGGRMQELGTVEGRMTVLCHILCVSVKFIDTLD